MRGARARGGADAPRRRALASTLRALVERTHDFTDSAYTSHKHRQRILALAERIAYELERLVSIAVSLVSNPSARPVSKNIFVIAHAPYDFILLLFKEEQGPNGSGAALESACAGAISAAGELERALVAAARDQARDLAPLADEAKRLAADLAHIGNPPRILGTHSTTPGSDAFVIWIMRTSLQNLLAHFHLDQRSGNKQKIFT